MSALVVFEDGRWLRIAGDAVTVRGEDLDQAMPAGESELVIAVMPGHEVTVHSASLPGLSDAQAQAAARTIVAEASMAPIDDLHVGAGYPDAEGSRTIVAAENLAVAKRLASLAAYGLDPDHLVAAPLLLPRPIAGFVRGDLGAETVLRGPDTAFADDPVLTPLIVEDSDISTLDRTQLERAVIEAISLPDADLRQGAFAKRRRLGIEWTLIRRMALILLAAGIVVFAAEVMDIIKRNVAASQIEADNKVRAAAVLPSGTIVTDPVGQVSARLSAIRGSGGGFRTLSGVLGTAVSATPNIELGSMVYDGETGLRATVRAPSPADLSALEARLTASGLTTTAGPIANNQGHPYRDITMRLP